jgi:hypothetical protein
MVDGCDGFPYSHVIFCRPDMTSCRCDVFLLEMMSSSITFRILFVCVCGIFFFFGRKYDRVDWLLMSSYLIF